VTNDLNRVAWAWSDHNAEVCYRDRDRGLCEIVTGHDAAGRYLGALAYSLRTTNDGDAVIVNALAFRAVGCGACVEKKMGQVMRRLGAKRVIGFSPRPIHKVGNARIVGHVYELCHVE